MSFFNKHPYLTFILAVLAILAAAAIWGKEDTNTGQ
jgi:hypothetical protein